MLYILLLNGCSMVSTVKKSLYLDTDKEASIAIIDYSITPSAEVKAPEATIYLRNIDTGEESHFYLKNFLIHSASLDRSLLAINLDAGRYEFSRWDYDACKREGTDIKSLFLCKEKFHFKGKNRKLEEAKFTIKKGETLYLGYISLDSNEASLTLRYSLENRDKPLIFKGRSVKNISQTIKMVDWKFEMTGYKGVFEW